MLSLKPGVRITGLRPEILLAVVAAERAYAEAGLDTMVTSCIEGKHSSGSFHYAGAAADLRTNHVPADKLQTLVEKIRVALGGDFDVILEADHLHIEFQPKRSLTNA